MSAQDENWEDLRLVLAITRGRGLSGASRLLGCHHATVLRRLNSLEHRSGALLFHRSALGYEPTKEGEELARLAEGIEEDVLAAYRKLAGNDLRLSGTIRCATSDYLAQTILPGLLKQFRQQYPEISIEICVSTAFASLTKRDADVALRATIDAPDELYNQCLTKIGFGVYASPHYLSAVGEGCEISEMDWIGEDDSLAHVSTYQWRLTDYPEVDVKLKFDSLLGKYNAVCAGIGIAILPHYMARSPSLPGSPLLASPPLVCLAENHEGWELGLWMLTHKDLRHVHRIRAFMRCAESYISQLELTG